MRSSLRNSVSSAALAGILALSPMAANAADTVQPQHQGNTVEVCLDKKTLTTPQSSFSFPDFENFNWKDLRNLGPIAKNLLAYGLSPKAVLKTVLEIAMN